MMGLLRDALDDSTRELIADEICSNIVTLPPAEIREHLPHIL
jgi:NADPH:quinone reductase-like Zn-dependent oxidoreductase